MSVTHKTVGRALSVGLVLLALTAGCKNPPMVNAYVDDSIPNQHWTTPSRDGILASGHEPTNRQRFAEPRPAPHVSYDVPHYPLWWEDPFIAQGDRNDTFAWTWQDYLAMPYGLGRFMLNGLAQPVSVIVTPPGTYMVSDGCVDPDEHPHDAVRGYNDNPTATQSDFGFAEAKANQAEPHNVEK